MIAASSFFARGIILKLAGRFFDMNLENETRELCVGKPVEMMGFLKRPEVKSLLAESQVGLVALHPLENYLDSLPVKMFEYMAAGLPVIASDFPFWQKIIAENACGISVDPLEPEKIARAVNWLLENPQQAEEMGRNGKKAVSQKFNWQNEEKKLLGLYSDLFAS
jgi:glycosyltransferase involved in cell wall biosynthesis